MVVKLKLLNLFFLLLLLMTGVHAGTITTYTDRATFDAAVGATTVEDFLPNPHFPISSGVLNDQTNEAGIVPGDIQSGVTYSTAISTGNFFNIDAVGGFTGGFLDRLGSTGIAPLVITFDNPVAAFAFDTNSLMGSQFSYTISFSSDPALGSQDTVAGTTAMQFFGYQSSQADIVSVTIQGNSTRIPFAIDNFTFAQQSMVVPPGIGPAIAIPALSTYGLFLLVLGLAFAARRRMTCH